MVQPVGAAFDKLTPREREILRLIAAHLQSKEIARELGLSPKTVEMHVLSARRRLSGMSRRDAALAFVAWDGGARQDFGRRSPVGRSIADAPGLAEIETPAVRADRRRRLTAPRRIGRALGILALTMAGLAATAVGMDAFIMAIQRITHY